MVIEMEREHQPRRSLHYLTMVTMTCMILATASLLFLPDVDAPPHIELSLMGDHARAVEPGQSVGYIIKVANTGEYRVRSYDLVLSTIPEGWEADLSKKSFNLYSREYELTQLTVTAPQDSDYDNVAYISVRGDDDTGNETDKVGTVTFTTSSTATVLRQGLETTLMVGDDIRSEDRVWTHADSTAAFRLTDEFFSSDIYTILTPESEIYVEYQTSSSPSVRSNDTEFDLLTTSVTQGKVYFYQEGNPTNDTSDVDPGVRVLENLSAMSYVDVTIPRNGFRESTLFSVEVDPDDQSIVTTMYQGTIDISSQQGTEELASYHSMTVQQDGTMGTADWISKTIVTIKGNAELNITVDGKLINNIVNDVPGADVLPVGDTNIFILSPDSGFSILTTSLGVGDYSITILLQQGDTTKCFTFSNIAASSTTHETFTWDAETETITVSSNAGKTYDLKISYYKGEVVSVFSITDVDLKLNEEQSYQVRSGKWEVLDDPDGRPVKFTRGDESVNIGTGMDGTVINGLLEEKVEEVKEHRGLLTFLTLLLVILLVGLFTITRWYPYYEELAGMDRSSGAQSIQKSMEKETETGEPVDTGKEQEADADEPSETGAELEGEIDGAQPSTESDQEVMGIHETDQEVSGTYDDEQEYDRIIDPDAPLLVGEDEIMEGEAFTGEDTDDGPSDSVEEDAIRRVDPDEDDIIEGDLADDGIMEGELADEGR